MVVPPRRAPRKRPTPTRGKPTKTTTLLSKTPTATREVPAKKGTPTIRRELRIRSTSTFSLCPWEPWRSR